jgi:hypothetical protein
VLIFALIILGVIFSPWRPWTNVTNLTKSSHGFDHVFYSPNIRQAKLRYEKCASTVATTSQHYEYNITNEETAAQWRFLDSTRTEMRRSFRGQVKINRGDPMQASDIAILVLTRSNSEEDIRNVVLHQSESGLGLEYVGSDKMDICTEVEVFMFLRPRPAHLLHLFEFQSHVLDIKFNDRLDWEVENLVVQSSHGDITFASTKWGFSHAATRASYDHEFLDVSDEASPLASNNVTLSSTSGDITGYYVAKGHVNARSEDGWLGLALIPQRDGTVNLESISVYTVSGTIHVEVAIPYWPSQPHTHITEIHTVFGELWAYIPHGSFTNLTSDEAIMAVIIPYGTVNPNDPSEIHTHSKSGYTHVRLKETDPDSLEGRYDPLLNTISNHRMEDGKLELIYPKTWFGTLEARIDHGPLIFHSSALRDIERGEGYVKANRGDKGDSRLDAYVQTGDMTIQLGL